MILNASITKIALYCLELLMTIFIYLMTSRSKCGAQSKKPVLSILTWKQIFVVSNIILDPVFMLQYVFIISVFTFSVCCYFSLWILIVFQVGSADHHIHYFDLRNTSTPLRIFKGHWKAVSYVKFLSTNELASASTDSTLRLWDVKDTCPVCFTGFIFLSHSLLKIVTFYQPLFILQGAKLHSSCHQKIQWKLLDLFCIHELLGHICNQ